MNKKLIYLMVLSLVLISLTSCDLFEKSAPKTDELTLEGRMYVVGENRQNVKVDFKEANLFRSLVVLDIKPENNLYNTSDTIRFNGFIPREASGKKVATVTNTGDKATKVIVLFMGGTFTEEYIPEDYEKASVAYNDLLQKLSAAKTDKEKTELGKLFDELQAKGYAYVKELKANQKWDITCPKFKIEKRK